MNNLSTSFASAERLDRRIIEKQSNFLFSEKIFGQLLDCVPIIIMVLNHQRQLVFGNKALLDFLAQSSLDEMLGKRPGEILHCIHAKENLAGCGTTKFCRYCGAVNAILSSQKKGHAVSECRILADIDDNEEAYDFRVSARQFKESFTFFSIVDIADEKRRLFLERIFLHDIANSCNSLIGFSNLVDNTSINETERNKFISRIKLLSNRMGNEIKAHQQLIAAEYNQLKIDLQPIDSLHLITEILESNCDEEMLNGRKLQLDKGSQQLIFHTDKILLNRVISNMVKNGLEGSAPGELVTMGCYTNEEHVCFWVHNPTYIPENIRLQIFERSFSTKGAGRGLGTYSMKYFTEKYLHGSVNFTTDKNQGTRFTVCLNREVQ